MEEIWKDIDGYNGLYQVSNKGNVRSWKKGRYGRSEKPRLLSLTKTKTGYYKVKLTSPNIFKPLVHRLVAKAFIPNPINKSQVNHIDCNKINNCVDNLEWTTQQENMDHAKQHDLHTKGEDNNTAKLKKNDVLDIRNAYKLGCFSQSEIADAYNVSQTSISAIITKRNWSHI